ncbi:hypothetical protein OSSY52_02200 [Tepiditoga spiralis]|uniref:Uncharacterized protein n=1 Tax=Tepiditoga spiralis TaxID=2108365 RepID=A0A7G1G9S0_9BACT|nr:hypothetical protein [Tepiditoga spiralis]BBE30079.1 hypothetical protein OSSY52_02200 [Tepiditoga spiralis]
MKKIIFIVIAIIAFGGMAFSDPLPSTNQTDSINKIVDLGK